MGGTGQPMAGILVCLYKFDKDVERSLGASLVPALDSAKVWQALLTRSAHRHEGRQAAEALLSSAGISDVKEEPLQR